MLSVLLQIHDREEPPRLDTSPADTRKQMSSAPPSPLHAAQFSLKSRHWPRALKPYLTRDVITRDPSDLLNFQLSTFILHTTRQSAAPKSLTDPDPRR